MFGVECKRTDTPVVTPPIRIVLDDLKLDGIAVVYPGGKRFLIAPNVEAVPLCDVPGGELFDRVK